MSLKEIVFATNNAHKLQEVRHHLKDYYRIISLDELGFDEDIPEPYDTLEENALAKTSFIHEKYSVDCFADDTGLEVEALGGAPGVYSARYAGPQCSFEDNVKKLLEELDGKANRNAKFRTIISLILNGQPFSFEGQVSGVITEMRSGIEGFGYDPIFQPIGTHKTFAQMSLDEKNHMSHRGRAVAKLVEFLRQV